MKISKWPLIVPFIVLTLFYSLFFFQKTNLAASDLGRHIMNGKIIVEAEKVFSTNLYSYTNRDYFVPNHHWLFGVITYYVEKVSGFGGLTVMSALLYTGAVGIVLWQAGKKSGKTAMCAAGILALPLITARSEIRPEAFSLFFFALELLLLLKWQEKKIALGWAVIIFGIISILWVNIHIFFILQFLLIGAFGLQALVQKKWNEVLQFCILGMVVVAGVLCNPLGLTGALYPFQILGDYGYRVAENQSPFFFLLHFPSLFYWYVAGFFLVAVTGIICIFKQITRNQIAIFTLFFALLILTNKLVRFENFFALLAIIPLANTVQMLRKRSSFSWKTFTENTVFLSIGSLVGFSILVFVTASGIFFPFKGFFGIGLLPKMNASAEFFKQLRITGPIFNNFDIGSYLIYHLYPDHQVFVDNRAEAYPSAFLKEYVSVQQDSEAWKKLDQKYRFRAIYFYRLENTEWGQQFLVDTIKRTEWVPIYVDDYTIIFIRDIPEHAEIIKKYRLPSEMFGIKKQ